VPAENRPDPVALLEQQGVSRLLELVIGKVADRSLASSSRRAAIRSGLSTATFVWVRRVLGGDTSAVLRRLSCRLFREGVGGDLAWQLAVWVSAESGLFGCG
jgi:hypothetical protein